MRSCVPSPTTSSSPNRVRIRPRIAAAASHGRVVYQDLTRINKAIAFSDEVQQEDITLCENVQRGLRSSTYDRGRYSVKRENGVHHFHMLLSEFLGKEAPSNQRPEQAGA